MALSPTNKTTAKQALRTQQLLLESLVGIATKHINEQVLDVAGRMVAALLDLSEPGIDAREVYQRVKSANLLKENSYAFVHVATGELEKSLPSISQKMLTQSLKELERDGIIMRTAYPVVPPKVDYTLTTLGESLILPLNGLLQWAEEHILEVEQARTDYQTRENK